MPITMASDGQLEGVEDADQDAVVEQVVADDLHHCHLRVGDQRVDEHRGEHGDDGGRHPPSGVPDRDRHELVRRAVGRGVPVRRTWSPKVTGRSTQLPVPPLIVALVTAPSRHAPLRQDRLVRAIGDQLVQRRGNSIAQLRSTSSGCAMPYGAVP